MLPSEWTKAEIKQHWMDLIAALRSGEFKQAQKALHTDAGFCCLGVGCELVKRKTGEGEWLPGDTGDIANSYRFAILSSSDSATWTSLDAVKRFYGVSIFSPLDTKVNKLPGLNDGTERDVDPDTGEAWEEGSEALTFPQIADWIEKNILPLLEPEDAVV